MMNLLPLLLFACSSSITPGPNNLMMLNSGLHFGVKRSLPHFLGICLGFPLMTFVVALGLGAIFTQYIWIKHILKIIGSLYMLYLAKQMLALNTVEKDHADFKPFTFIQALLFQWVNPKGWLMAIGAIAIYTLSTNYLSNAVFISVIYLLMCLPCVGLWLFCGSLLQKILKNDKQQRVFNIIMAACLVASIALIYLE